jgi:hypothetical protein
MRQTLFATVVVLGALAPAVSLASEPGPSVDRIKSAAGEYDAGRRAFTEKHFEEAAVHFENAYRDAPNAQTLRSAMRARRQAGQLARASTLAALAQLKYASDAPTAAASRETLAEAEPKLQRVTVACDPECGIASDGRIATIEDGVKHTLYLEAGSHAVVVSWAGDRSKELRVDAKAGGKQDLALAAPPMPVAPPPPPVATVAPQPSGALPGAPPAPPAPEKPLPPAVFFAGLGLTVASAAVLVWSGIDTVNNPGVDAVRAQCINQGESCAAYQTGRSAQLRTNVLIGVTAGVFAITGVVGLLFTRWTPRAKEPLAAALSPSFALSPQGGAMGLSGAF